VRIDTAVPAETLDCGYAVTLVVRTSNDHHLQPPLKLPEGITAEIDGPEVLLTVPVRAPDARTALVAAQASVTDLLHPPHGRRLPS
jgi:hypothetical protein